MEASQLPSVPPTRTVSGSCRDPSRTSIPRRACTGREPSHWSVPPAIAHEATHAAASEGLDQVWTNIALEFTQT